MFDTYFPRTVNTGPWVTAYTLNRLRSLPDDAQFILPICSIATSYSEIASLGEFLLPPLFHEAMNDELKRQITDRIVSCFPMYGAASENRKRLSIVELPAERLPPRPQPNVLAFSVDTAVEEHGPHLPLCTDTIQSYSVLQALSESVDGITLFRPLEYGQLTWGLPFGFSVDLTAELLTDYVACYVNAIDEWLKPESVYVVDVHGSITHRAAIVQGLEDSRTGNWAFRWLHEPLAEFASQRGDQHAGGVETALVERVSSALLDAEWWPGQLNGIAKHQMSFEEAVALTPDLPGFQQHVNEHGFNGVIGDIRNYSTLDADDMFHRMLQLAISDVRSLQQGKRLDQTPGKKLW